MALFQNCAKGSSSTQDSSSSSSNFNSVAGSTGDANLPVIPADGPLPPIPPITSNPGSGLSRVNIRLLINQSSSQIFQNIEITATGSGISTPVVYTWTLLDPNNTTPASVTLTLPQGNARQIAVQVTALDPATNSTSTFIGSSTLDVLGSTVDVNIILIQQL